MISVDRLSGMKIFEKTSGPALERLAQAMESKSYPAGEVICKEGNPSSALFLVASGFVEVLKKIDASTQESKKVARLDPEEFFGEMAFLEQAPYSATVVAGEAAEIFLLPREEMQKLLKQDPSVLLDQVLTLFSGLSTRLRQTTSEMVTVFEVARIIGQGPDAEELLKKVIQLVQPHFGSSGSLAFYLWNPFNDEYSLISSTGDNSQQFPSIVDRNDFAFELTNNGFQSIDDLSEGTTPFSSFEMRKGQLLMAPINRLEVREGLFLAYIETAISFNRKHLQLMETVAGVLAPALAGARIREEEKIRLRFERGRQERYLQ